MRRRWTYVVLGLVLLAAAGVVVWRVRAARDSGIKVTRSTMVERGSMEVTVTASGRIQPASRVGLTFETPGTVAEVFVVEGDRVAVGDELARLVTDQLEEQVAQAEAALTAAQSQLAAVRATPRQGEIEQAKANVRGAEARLSAAEANRNQLLDGPSQAEIASVEAQLAQANVSQEIAQDNYDLIEEEGKQKEQANYDLYTAKQEVAAAEARLEDVRGGPADAEMRAARANVAASLAQRDAAQAQLDELLSGATEEDIAEVEAQVEQARIALQLAEHTLKRATLRAPFQGLVTQINATPGELPPTREASFVLLDDSRFHITVAVDELDISDVQEGQDVEITVEALPGASLGGTVSTISPIATLESGVVAYEVTIELNPTSAPLRADMTANATIIVGELTDILKIPIWVVRIDRDTGATYVQRRTGDEIERVDVELGARSEGIAQVISGVSAGDELVRLEDSGLLSSVGGGRLETDE